MFYDKYLNLCNSIGKSPSAVAEEIGIKRSTVTRWKQGNSQTDANIHKVANYFGVSFDWLKEETDQKEKSPAPEDAELSLTKIQLIEKIKRMDDNLVAILNNLADEVLSAQGK